MQCPLSQSSLQSSTRDIRDFVELKCGYWPVFRPCCRPGGYLVFDGQVTGSEQGDMAIDDISVTQGPCEVTMETRNWDGEGSGDNALREKPSETLVSGVAITTGPEGRGVNSSAGGAVLETPSFTLGPVSSGAQEHNHSSLKNSVAVSGGLRLREGVGC